VPSLFTFTIDAPWLRALSGLSITPVELFAPEAKHRETGPALITHWGLSGPAALRLSAWGARQFHTLGYRFQLLVNWLPSQTEEKNFATLSTHRQNSPARTLFKTPFPPLPARLWEALATQAGIPADTRWAALSNPALRGLARQLARTELQVSGKSANKDEFVTCGGVSLREVNMKTMESRICPNLFFGGELLDIDGVTGGFNFQAAWTTGWIAGHAMAQKTPQELRL
jgi:predicted Rossmann fold flavoprotein